MDAKPKTIKLYVEANGKTPFTQWLDTLRGQKIHGIILSRNDRVAKGNFGDHHSVGKGVSELVFDFGPGYRVYFGREGDEVILLTGGTKGTQTKDIAEAQRMWSEYNA